MAIAWDSSQEHAAQQMVKEGLLRVNEEKSLIVCLTKNETIYESTKEKADA